jgi:hypothetical protein
MPRPNKRKKQLAAVQDGTGKRQMASKLGEEKLKVPKEESSPIDAIVAPETITSLHGKKRTLIATAVAKDAINTALPDVVTSFRNRIDTEIAGDATSTALPDVVTSLPPANLDVVDANTDSMTDTQSNNHPRAINPSAIMRTSTLQIKLEPVVKTETASAFANLSSDQAEASIPMETVSNGPNLNPTVTVYRKATKRTFPWDKAAGESPSTQAGEIASRKKSRVVQPLPTTGDEAVKKTASPAVSECVPSPDTPPSTDTANAPTCRRSRRQMQLRAIETREEQPDDADDANADDCDLSGRTSPSDAFINASTRRRSSRRVISTSNTGAPVPHPSTTTVDVSSRRRSRRQTQRPPIETREAQIDDDDECDGADLPASSWEVRLSELAEYRALHGNCNVPKGYSENSKLANWVNAQRKTYKLNREGKTSPMTLYRIQQLKSLGFEWGSQGAAWAKHLSELTDYHKIHGHCNVPPNNSENSRLADWVKNQRTDYRLNQEGKTSRMTLYRIQELESLGFEWVSRSAAWKDRLSELADFRALHGHSNVTENCSGDTKLVYWVSNQRSNYKVYQEGKTSCMTPFRIRALESLGFEWKAATIRGKGARKK